MTGDRKLAMGREEEVLQMISQMSKDLKSTQMGIKILEKKEVMEALRKGIKDLLYLSQKQEVLNAKIREAQKNPKIDPRELGIKEKNLERGTTRVANDLYKLSQKTFFLGSEIGKELGEALSKMAESAKNLESGNLREAAQQGDIALSALNRTAMGLMKAQTSLLSSSSASGLEEALEKLASLSSRQQGVNEGTQGFIPLLSDEGGLSLEEREGLARLAAEQEAIRRELEEIQKFLGERESLLNRLDQIGQEMKEVIDDLKEERVERKILEKQERILTRLLDFQKSLRQENYKEKRKAEAGKEYPDRARPGRLPEDYGEKRRKIRDDLLRALKEAYPPEYEEWIKAYFKALAEVEESKK